MAGIGSATGLQGATSDSSRGSRIVVASTATWGGSLRSWELPPSAPLAPSGSSTGGGNPRGRHKPDFDLELGEGGGHFGPPPTLKGSAHSRCSSNLRASNTGRARRGAEYAQFPASLATNREIRASRVLSIRLPGARSHAPGSDRGLTIRPSLPGWRRKHAEFQAMIRQAHGNRAKGRARQSMASNDPTRYPTTLASAAEGAGSVPMASRRWPSTDGSTALRPRTAPDPRENRALILRRI